MEAGIPSERELYAASSPRGLLCFQEETQRAELFAAELCARRSECRVASCTISSLAREEREHVAACDRARSELRRQREEELSSAEAAATAKRMARDRAALQGQLDWEQQEQSRKMEARSQRERELRDARRRAEAEAMRRSCQREEQIIRWRAARREQFRRLYSEMSGAEEAGRAAVADEDAAVRCDERRCRAAAERSAAVAAEDAARACVRCEEVRCSLALAAAAATAPRSQEIAERKALVSRKFRDYCQSELRQHERRLSELWQVQMEEEELERREARRQQLVSAAEAQRRSKQKEVLKERHEAAESDLRAWRQSMEQRTSRIHELRCQSAERRRSREKLTLQGGELLGRLHSTLSRLPQGGAMAYLRSAHPPPPQIAHYLHQQGAADAAPADTSAATMVSSAASALESTLVGSPSAASPDTTATPQRICA